MSVLQASLLSSHRTFVTKVDVVELTDELSGRGDNICLFVFSDCIEVRGHISSVNVTVHLGLRRHDSYGLL